MKEIQEQGPSTSVSCQCNCSRKKLKCYVSYRKIYDAYGKNPIYWIPNQPVKISVQNAQDGSKLIRIEVEHGKFKWAVVKNSRDLAILNRKLRQHRAIQKIPRPRIRRHSQTGESYEHDEHCPCNTGPQKQPSKKIRPNFKKLNYQSSSEEDQKLLHQDLEKWVQQILNSPNYRHFDELKKFFEISPYSFLNEFSTKNQEGVVKIKYIKDNKFNIKNMKEFLLRLFFPWKTRWLLVNDSFIAFIDAKKKNIRGIMLFDEGFQINKNELKDEATSPKEFIISDQNQDLRIKCSNAEEAQRWQATFNTILHTTGTIWLQSKRFGSSFPPRQKNFCQPLVDGEAFFEKIADTIEMAKDDIFISSWWICPELYMKRPMVEGHKWRLDQLLLRAAKRGVHVFILQYNELKWAFGHNSIYGKRMLKKLHKNIKIMRHPDHFSDQGTLIWAHHEKFVVVDQLIAFIGGTDLCFGRWDNEKHPLKDLGSIAYVPSKFKRQVSIQQETSTSRSNDDTNSTAVIKKETSMELLEVENGSESGDSIENYKIKHTHLQNTRFDITVLKGGGILYPGKEYVNLNFHDFEEVDKPFMDQIDRYSIPRLPWHDVNTVIYGESARDLARHFIQRWNATKAEKFRSDTAYPYLLPKAYDSIQVPEIFLNDDTCKCEVQVLRSASKWSIGFDKTETSILKAYHELITNSKHYIYIENLFFVSMIDSDDVTNGICEVLCERIVKADQQNENFRVFINLPLRPGYAGDIKKGEYSTLIVLMNLSYTSISRGPNSLIENLKRKGVADPWRYLSVTSLRTYDDICGKLTTEMVYIHTKTMIVDDLHVIIGSANINDRSLLGDRDSEVDLLISDQEFIDSKMDGNSYQAGKFAYALRQRLMREHLGLLPGMPEAIKSDVEFDIEDPISEQFFNDVWKFYARQNTRIYEEVFHAFPTDRIETYDELKKYREEPTLAETDPDLAKKKLEKIVGYLNDFPLSFLKQENLSPEIGTKEYLIPTEVYT